ncbi:MAG TPA: glycosyltransferase family 4 protein [Chloroflexota bacterium]
MPELSVLLVGTYPPRHDGLATFAADLGEAMCDQGTVRLRVIAIDSQGETCHYNPSVVGRIEQPQRDSYLRAADLVRRLHPDVVCLQHEFGLWGIWQDELVDDFAVPFVQRVSDGADRVPVVTTLHTIRPDPADFERDVLRELVQQSAAAVVMARTGAIILTESYHADPDRLIHIPHGVPVVEQHARRYFKRRLGLEGRTIISTLGLLDRRKGIDYAIVAMREVVERHPDALYLVVGETHPEVRKHQGEQYRNELGALVQELGLADHVRFVNQYVSERELVGYLQASDIYLTPYLDRNQITSGTLAFAIGMGKAIISTPYLHATEALAEGRGLLAELRSAESIAQCILIMLDNPHDRREMEDRMAAYGKRFAWPLVGAQYVELFRLVTGGESLADLIALRSELPLA